MMMRASAVAVGAPAWVYILLIALIVLGVRRLRTREILISVALMPSAAFFIWSIVGAVGFADSAGEGVAAGVWVAGACVGVFTGIWLPEPRGIRLPRGRVRQPGSWLPLILYLGVFAVRFACGAWASIEPAQAMKATALGLAVGAAMTARLIVGVARWQRPGFA